MPIFIKTGYWEKQKQGFKGWLNLEDTFSSNFAQKQNITNDVTILTDASVIDLSSIKNTLTSSSASRIFTISYEGDDITLKVLLNTTGATYTFPVTSLCVSEGVPSGNNILSISGTSGDTFIIGIKKFDNTYYVVSKNFGQ